MRNMKMPSLLFKRNNQNVYNRDRDRDRDIDILNQFGITIAIFGSNNIYNNIILEK